MWTRISQPRRFWGRRYCVNTRKWGYCNGPDTWRDTVHEALIESLRLDELCSGKKRGGRQKPRWKGSCKRCMESAWLKEKDALDRTKWKNDIQYHSRWWESARRRRREECEPVEECGRGGSTVFESLGGRVHRKHDMKIQHHLQP